MSETEVRISWTQLVEREASKARENEFFRAYALLKAERDALQERLEILRAYKAGKWEVRMSGIWAQLVEREAEWAARVGYFAGSSKARESEFFRSYDLLIAERDGLRAALEEYMSQFGQALEAYGIPYGPAQKAADVSARAALDNKKES